MGKTVSAGLFGALLILAEAGQANAFSRSGTVTGPRGTTSVQAQGACVSGSCWRSITRTGPHGATMSRSGVAHCANSHCAGVSTTTGPRGGTVTRSGSITLY